MKEIPQNALNRGWQEFWLAKPKTVSSVASRPNVPLAAHLGPLGVTGATAYFGVLDVGRPRAGATVVVSAAAGAVGSLVGQIAKLLGCRVVGIVGSQAKYDWIVGELGFDAAINYRTSDILPALRTACPAGIDMYFDNVGGDTLNAALSLINLKGCMVVCGFISAYNQIEEATGPAMFHNVMMKRARIEGFIISDYYARWPEAAAAIGSWIDRGLLKYRMDVRRGIECAPEALQLLFEGRNDGKLVVEVSPPR